MELLSFICFVAALMELRREWPHLSEVLEQHIQRDIEDATKEKREGTACDTHPTETVSAMHQSVLFPLNYSNVNK